MSKADVEKLHNQMQSMAGAISELAKSMKPAAARKATQLTDANGADRASISIDQIYEEVKTRLASESPRLLNVAAIVPELNVTEQIRPINASTEGKSALMGRIALLIAEGFFDQPKTDENLRAELARYGLVAQKTYANVTFASNMASLVSWGFLRKEASGYQANPKMKKHIKRAGQVAAE